MVLSTDQKGDLDKTLKELNLSDQEVDKFSKAFKDPEFLKLFEEYAKEVSDPKVKAETDLYLRQLEAEGRGEEVYGKDVMLIVPTEAFVIKTKDNSSGTKVFVNICTSDKLEKLTMKTSKGPDGKTGKDVQIPLSLSHKKTGEDRQGKAAWVWDFVVHPETVQTAHKMPAIKQLMVDTALEKIESVHQLSLSRQYRALNIKYKGTPEAPKPHVLSVRTGGGQGPGATAPGARIAPVNTAAPAVSGVAGAVTGKDATAGQLRDTGNKPSAARSAFRFPEVKQTAAKAEALLPHQAGYKHESGEVTPQWEIIHRGQIDLSECWGDSGRNLAAAPPSWPQQLVLRLQLPGCTSAATLQLDVGTQVASVVLPGKFKLEVSLPFPVDDSKGKAKFDKVKQHLEVVLPTLPPPRPPPSVLQPPPLVSEQEPQPGDLGEEATPEDCQATGTEAGCDQPEREQVGQGLPVGTTTSGATEAAGAHAVDGAGHEDASASPTDALTENQRRWAELHEEQLKEAQEAANRDVGGVGQPSWGSACGEEAAGGGVETGAGGSQMSVQGAGLGLPPEFEAAGAWAGARPGMVFKLGASGLGYYRDLGVQKSVVGRAAGQASQGAQEAQDAAVPQTVTLKPRLFSSLADDLD